METVNYKKRNISTIILLFIGLIALNNCKNENCDYDVIDPPVSLDCSGKSELNLSTGIDAKGNTLVPGFGVKDPYWKLINIPPISGCSGSTIDGSAYVINYPNLSSTTWVNQAGASVLAPADLGAAASFGCNNPQNSNGDYVPYIFERPFCVSENTRINLNFTYLGDDVLRLELFDNSSNTTVMSSPTYTWPSSIGNWSATGVNLTAGSYSLRAYLSNTVNVVLGFSVVGNMTTTDGDAVISNNSAGCCENNTISVLNVIENNCDQNYQSGEQVGSGYTFTLKNSSGTAISTRTSDINGNAIFTGLPNGSYSVTITPQSGFTPNVITQNITVSNNSSNFLNFYNCN